MKSVSLATRLRYEFDNLMARGTIALLALLFIVTVAMIMIIAFLVTVTGVDVREDGSHIGFPALVWMVLLRTLDPGTMGGDTGSEFFLGSMLLVTFGGIFVVSILIGIISNGITQRVEELRKGRSFVVESNHTLILGWSPSIFSIISELMIANANQTRSSIVILANQDKVEMEDEIRGHIGSTGKTRVVCRSGNPIELADLEIVNPHAARSIIILAPEVADPDSHVIKTILALTNNPNRRADPYHIVAEIRNPKNMQVAQMVGRDQAEFVLVGDLISRITVQTCRQSGLSVVYTELLDFGGDEIYFYEEPRLVGKTFGQALLMYEDSALIGLRKRDGRVLFKPSSDMLIETGDRAIAISEDDDTVKLSGLTELGIEPDAICQQPPQAVMPERTLILGWNQRTPITIRELDNYVAPSSAVTVVSDISDAENEIARRVGDLKNQTLNLRLGDTTDRRVLDDLNIPSYNHVIVLSYSDTLDPQAADARTLITLLHLRDIREKCGCDFSIVSEMLDVRNRELAEVTHADDFIVSDKLVSLMLSQVSENKELGAVFADIFDPEGAEIYLKPATNYVELGRPVNFYTVVEAAKQRNEIAIGYRLRALAGDAAQAYGVKVNPRKSERVTFAEPDRIIVVAES